MSEISKLRQVPLFAEMDEQELGALRKLMQSRQFAPGQVIIREGDPGDFFYIITEGHVQFSTSDATGTELLLDEAGVGGFFGELSMLTGEPRAVRVRAKDRVSTLALDRARFFEFLEKNPAASLDVLSAVARRLHRTDTLLRQSVTPNVNVVADERATVGQRVADSIACMIGSWPFIVAQTVVLAGWITLNVVGWVRQWDPKPFVVLNLVLAIQAAYAAPIIMMSQNRSSAKDRLAAEIDHETNVKAEVKIGLIMRRLDDLERSLHDLHDEQRGLLKQLLPSPADGPARRT